MKKKMLLGLASVLLTVLLFAMPIIATGAVIAVPIQAVSEFFQGIGSFLFGDGSTEADELVVLIRMAFSNRENQTAIQKTYSSYLIKHDVRIPEHYLAVPQFLAGIEFEDMNKETIEKMVNAAIKETYNKEKDETTYELHSTESYATNLLKLAPFNTKLSSLDSETLAMIINQVGSMESSSSLPPELLEKYKGKMIYPLKKFYPVGDSVGWYNPSGNKWEQHSGLDIQAPCGTPTYAMDDGVVTMVGDYDHWRGNYIIWNQGEQEMRYLHFRDPLNLRIGDEIKKGQFIGLVGNTGYSFGCHLHLEIRIDGQVMDPLDFIDFYNPILE